MAEGNENHDPYAEANEAYAQAMRNLDPETGGNARNFAAGYRAWGNKNALKMTDIMKAAIVRYVRENGPYKGKICRGFEISGTCLNTHLTNDADFKEAWDAAYDEYYDALENEAFKRAYVGEMEPIIGGKDKDQIITYVARKSDRLLELMLKARRGEVFKDKVQMDATVNGGVLVIPTQAMSSEDWEATHSESAKGGNAAPKE